MGFRFQSPTPRRSLARFRYKRDVPLSRRQQQVLWLMCEGFAPYEIAEKLCRAHQTISGHRKVISEKTGCRTQVQLGVWAAHHGVI